MSESRRRRVCSVSVWLKVNECRLREWFSGSRSYKHCLRHRVDGGPAVELADGTCLWFEHGLRHRGGGLPAVECADGRREWWERDRFIRREEVSS